MKKGFTLIELLGVVTILGVLALILFPLVVKHITSAKNSISDVTKELIISSAKDYVDDNINLYKKVNDSVYCIGINKLNLVNTKDENLNNIDKTKKVKVTYSDGFFYEVVDSCGTYSVVVYFNANGGRVSPTNMTTNNGTSLILPIPTKSGAVFSGWYTNDNVLVDNTTVWNESEEIFAHWE